MRERVLQHALWHPRARARLLCRISLRGVCRLHRGLPAGVRAGVWCFICSAVGSGRSPPSSPTGLRTSIALSMRANERRSTISCSGVSSLRQMSDSGRGTRLVQLLVTPVQLTCHPLSHMPLSHMPPSHMPLSHVPPSHVPRLQQRRRLVLPTALSAFQCGRRARAPRKR